MLLKPPSYLGLRVNSFNLPFILNFVNELKNYSQILYNSVHCFLSDAVV